MNISAHHKRIFDTKSCIKISTVNRVLPDLRRRRQRQLGGAAAHHGQRRRTSRRIAMGRVMLGYFKEIYKEDKDLTIIVDGQLNKCIENI